jgi:serine/threonine protein kinase
MLVDFGIAKEADLATTTTGARGLTPGFSPPEQYGLQRTDAQSDQYALAATLYTLLTGQLPTDSFERLMYQQPLRPIRELNPKVPHTVETTIIRAMALKKDERFPSIEQFQQALHGQPLEETLREDALPQITTEVDKQFRFNLLKDRATALEKDGQLEQALSAWREILTLEPVDIATVKYEIGRIEDKIRSIRVLDEDETALEIENSLHPDIQVRDLASEEISAPAVPDLQIERVKFPKKLINVWRNPWLWGGMGIIIISTIAMILKKSACSTKPSIPTSATDSKLNSNPIGQRHSFSDCQAVTNPHTN